MTSPATPVTETPVASPRSVAPDYHPPCEEDPSGHWSKQEKEYVDQLCYQVVQRSTGTVMAMWGVPGDLMTGGEDVVQQNNMFQMHMRGGWFSSEPLIKTAPGPDPLLALMVAYLCAYEYSPKAIKHDLNSDFPGSPNGCPGWG